jgi:hypothetical protein
MAGVSDKARFYLERAAPELRVFEEKEIFSKVGPSLRPPTTPLVSILLPPLKTSNPPYSHPTPPHRTKSAPS